MCEESEAVNEWKMLDDEEIKKLEQRLETIDNDRHPKHREKQNPMCPDCDVEMEKRGSKPIGRVVMGQKGNSITLYQCDECKRVEMR